MTRVAVIQMISGGCVEDNLKQAAELLADAASQGAVLALLPENFALMSTSKLYAAGVEERTVDGPIRSFLAQQAQALGLWIIAGSVPISARPDDEPLADRIRQSCLVYADDGSERARYDKIHLFDVNVADRQAQYRESDTIESGELAPVCVDSLAGKLGLSICYDLRFAELYRALAGQGAELLTVPAAFTAVTGQAHWHALLRARAIENQCFVLAANQGGQHSKSRATYGHSMIVDPWGEVLAELESGPGVAVADIDLERLADVRRDMPMAEHRRMT